jgi:phospholipid/cholesterol/gamma-HCH transport system substrate-binding protein
MESRAHALAAGLFTIVLLITSIAMFLWLTRDTTIKTRYVLSTKGNVTGLKSQAPVRYKGLDVGSVEAIEFDPTRAGDLLIYIRVTDETPITNRTFAELGMLGVTGLSFVQLLEPPPKAGVRSAPRDPLTPIPLQASLLERVADSAENLASQGEEIAKRLNALLSDERQKELYAAVADIRSTTVKFGALADDLRPAAQSLPAFATEARKVMTNADSLVTDLRGVTERVNQRLGGVDAAMASVKEATVKLSDAADDVRLTARSFNEQTLPRVNRLALDLTRSTHTATRIIDRIGDEPHSVLFGSSPGKPGPGEPGFSFKDQR